MKTLTCILAALFLALSASAQRLDNKINIFFGYQIGGFQGPTMVTHGSFTAPSLFANFEKLRGLSVKGVRRVHKFYDISIGASYSMASDWKNGASDDFTQSTIGLFSLSPGIQFHTPFKTSGFLNVVRPFLAIEPTIGFSNLKLDHSTFDIQGQNGAVQPPLTSMNLFGGVKASTGLQFVISNSMGVYLSYSYQYNRISSELFNDKSFIAWMAEAGFYVRLKTDKQLY